MQKITAVVLHYENEKLTNQCVDSIEKTAPNVRVIVVDNYSPSAYKRDHAIILRNDNRDAVSGMNLGFYHAVHCLHSDFVVNMDNDVICLPGWLDPLLSEMNRNPKTGIAGGKQWDEKKTCWRSVGMDLIGGHLFRNAPVLRESVFWIQGSFVMMRSRMMKKIGLHDERFRIICSDSDYCLHAKDRGWDVVFVPESEVIHLGGASYTGPCESWAEDNIKLVHKWSGISAYQMLHGFPLDIKDNRHIKMKFEVSDAKCLRPDPDVREGKLHK